MLEQIGLVLVLTGIIAVHVPELVKKKMWKELAVFFIFFSLALIYSLGKIYGMKLPNPTKTMEYLFEPTWKAIEKIFPQ